MCSKILAVHSGCAFKQSASQLSEYNTEGGHRKRKILYVGQRAEILQAFSTKGHSTEGGKSASADF